MILSCPQNFCLNLCYTVSPPFILEIWKLFVKWQLQILIDAEKKVARFYIVSLFSSKTDMVGNKWSKTETYGCECDCGRESYVCL